MSASERLRLGGEIIESGLPWPMLVFYPPGNRADLGSDIARGGLVLTSVRGGWWGETKHHLEPIQHSRVKLHNVTSSDKSTDELKINIERHNMVI